MLLMGSRMCGFAWRMPVCLWKRRRFAPARLMTLGLYGAPCAHPSWPGGLKLVLFVVGAAPPYVHAGFNLLKPTQ